MNSSAPTYLIDDALWSRSLTKDLASQLTDQTLELLYGDMHGQTHTALMRVKSYQDRSKDGQSMLQFNLLFQGPAAPRLPTQTYRVRHAEWGDFAVLISAVGQSSEGIEYEACFSHER